jgi:hypothetical protein
MPGIESAPAAAAALATKLRRDNGLSVMCRFFM